MLPVKNNLSAVIYPNSKETELSYTSAYILLQWKTHCMLRLSNTVS